MYPNKTGEKIVGAGARKCLAARQLLFFHIFSIVEIQTLVLFLLHPIVLLQTSNQRERDQKRGAKKDSFRRDMEHHSETHHIQKQPLAHTSFNWYYFPPPSSCVTRNFHTHKYTLTHTSISLFSPILFLPVFSPELEAKNKTAWRHSFFFPQSVAAKLDTWNRLEPVGEKSKLRLKCGKTDSSTSVVFFFNLMLFNLLMTASIRTESWVAGRHLRRLRLRPSEGGLAFL